MMSRLPAPPQFLLPPPPMPSSDMIDLKIMSQLTCSSIRQYQQTTSNWRLFVLASGSALIAILLLTVTLIWLFSSRKRIQSKKTHFEKPATAINSINDLTMCSSRSYKTISSDHTGIYVESIDTSATTCSIDTTDVRCMECYYQHVLQPTPYYHILSIPDVVPN